MNETFSRDGDALVRNVWPKRGKPYEHVCWLSAYKKVLRAIDDAEGRSFTGADIVAASDQPHTQVYTALAFLKERGCIISARRRRSVVPTIFGVDLDGMIEWHALIHIRCPSRFRPSPEASS